MADKRFSALILTKIHYKKMQIGSLKNNLDICSRPAFGLTDVDLHEVINILNIIVSFSRVCTLK